MIKGCCRDRLRIGDVTEANLGPREIGHNLLPALTTTDSTAFTGERHHLVAALNQFFHHETTDVTGRPEHHHPNLLRGSRAEVVAESYRRRHQYVGI